VSFCQSRFAGRPLILPQLAVAVVLLASVSFAQQSPAAPPLPEPTFTGADQPLGTVARNSKKQPDTHAKKVITEDNMNAMPLPPLRMDSAENSDEVIAAIGEYKRTHTPDETEAAVRAWYERYDQDLAAAIEHNHVVSTLREENFSNGNEICRESGIHWYPPRPVHHLQKLGAGNAHSARVHERAQRHRPL
jgi:hypothetical protein